MLKLSFSTKGSDVVYIAICAIIGAAPVLFAYGLYCIFSGCCG